MVYRPRDLCTAAFQNDVQRLRLLLAQNVSAGYDADETTREEDDLVESAIDADPEMQRIREQYTLQQGDGEDEDESEEEDEASYERANASGAVAEPYNRADEDEAQEVDLTQYRECIRKKLRLHAMAAEINRPGLLLVGTSVADVKPYGVLFRAFEVTAVDAAQPRRADGDADAAAPSTPEEDAAVARLCVQWTCSKRSPFRAYPLHWAVLGRAHAAIAFLLQNGADPTAEVQGGNDNATRPDDAKAANTTIVFPGGLTAERVARDNRSYETLRVLRAATAAQTAATQADLELRQKLESQLEQRKARREKRKLEREQRRVSREEAAMAAEVNGAPEEGNYDEEIDHEAGVATDNEVADDGEAEDEM